MNKILGIVIFTLIGCAGFFPYAEQYRFNIDRNELIIKIDSFKKKYPQYNCDSIDESYKPKDTKVYSFYSFHFCLNGMVIKCAINMSENVKEKPTILYLSGVIKNEKYHKLKRLNTKDLSKNENKEIKKMFEIEILDKLGKWERE